MRPEALRDLYAALACAAASVARRMWDGVVMSEFDPAYLTVGNLITALEVLDTAGSLRVREANNGACMVGTAQAYELLQRRAEARAIAVMAARDFELAGRV